MPKTLTASFDLDSLIVYEDPNGPWLLGADVNGLTEADEALKRNGYSRTGEWRTGALGSYAEVTR